MIDWRSWAGPLLVGGALLGGHFALTVPHGPKHKRPGAGAKKKGKGKGKGKKKKPSVREAKMFSEEDRDVDFAKIHEPVLKRVYELAYAAAFVRMADPGLELLEHTRCRQWRCQIELCGPKRYVRRVVRVMRTMEVEGEDLWDVYEVGGFEEGYGNRDEGLGVCQTATLRFSRTSPEPKGLRVAKMWRDQQKPAPKKTAKALRPSTVVPPKLVPKPSTKKAAGTPPN